MPKTTKSTRTPRSYTRNHTKRHGQHHKKSGHYVKVYAPYLPLFISIIASLLLSFWNPSSASTLAYATEISRTGLLSSTNSHRSSNGKASLTLNSQLNNSAQAKANDMVTRNYWSHNTPDGQEPWVFFENAGYSYAKAGENLAYGFATSADTVVGWMNSPTHKANMLDSAFTEVGFGFANSPNFNGDGQQTVVVAHYAKPVVAAATAPAPTTPQTAPATTTPAAPVPAPVAKPAPTPAPVAPMEKAVENPAPLTTEQPATASIPVSQNISRAQTLTKGQAPWVLTLSVVVTGLSVILLLLRHSLKARHLVHDLIHDTQRFVLHHPLLDSTLLGIAILGSTLLRTVGTIL